jgi:N-acyl-D-aspartate/D-glutamate deacylase
MSLESAVQRMTAVAANEIMAYDRGRLSVGLAADIVVFDEGEVRDRATFAEPDLQAEGIRYVMVNGAMVIEAGKYTGAAPGQVLRLAHVSRKPTVVAHGGTIPGFHSQAALSQGGR